MIMFRRMLELFGIEPDRVQVSWISAAEGKKFQGFITEITEKTRKLGPYNAYKSIVNGEQL